MTRVLLNLLAALSLLLCAAACGLWVRSYRAVECVARTSSGGWSCAAWSSVTGFELCGMNGLRAVETKWSYHSRPLTRGPVVRQAGGLMSVEQSHLGRPVPRAGFAGFGWTIDPQSPVTDPRVGTYSAGYWSFVVPHWFLAATTAAPVLWRMVPLLRRRARRAAGACQRCGYDLRATPGRGPECGTTASVTRTG